MPLELTGRQKKEAGISSARCFRGGAQRQGSGFHAEPGRQRPDHCHGLKEFMFFVLLHNRAQSSPWEVGTRASLPRVVEHPQDRASEKAESAQRENVP